MRTADPATGQLPGNIRAREIAFAATLPKSEDYYGAEQKDGASWTQMGPYNVGGRTRALALDVTNENIIIAGGAAGSMWRSTDAGKTWRSTSLPGTIKSVSF